MSNYISNYKNPFSWYKDYLKNLDTNGSVTIDPAFTPSVESQINTLQTNVTDHNIWNSNVLNLKSDTEALYKSIDQAFIYLTELNSKLEGPIQRLETEFKIALSQYKTQLFSKTITNSNLFSLNANNFSSINTQSDIYKKYPILSSEGDSFVLKDNGYASVIRSLNGFGGKIFVENTITNVFTNGLVNNCVDGSINTYFLIKSFVPNIVTTTANDVAWVPSNYKHGALTQLTLKLDSPALINELYIDPVSSEPFELLGVSWSSTNKVTITPTFPAATTLTGGTVVNGTAGLTGNSCLEVTNKSYGYHTIALPAAPLVTAGSNISTSRRVDIKFYSKVQGSSNSGVRIIWLNASSAIVGTETLTEFTTSFYDLNTYSVYAPPTATQFTIQLGVFETPEITSITYISNLSIVIDEEYQSVEETIDTIKTVKLAKNILTDRVSIYINQKNIKRSVKNIITTNPTDVSNIDLLPSTQNLFLPKLQSGSNSEFCYTYGLREIDLRYREHTPRGALLSKKFDTRKEIRKLWTTIEGRNLSGVNLQILLNDSDNTNFDITPFNLDESTNGQIIEVRTQEEVDNGIVNPNSSTIVINPITVTDLHNGTDRQSKITLESPIHVKKYLIKDTQKWLDTFAINPTKYDPNTTHVIGTNDQTIKDQYRNDPTSLTPIDTTDLIVKNNYIPLQVKITSDSWIANPDRLGTIQASTIRSVTSEQLQQVSTVSDSYQASTPVISFNTWLGQTSVSKALDLAKQYQFKTVIEDLTSLNISPNNSLSSIIGINNQVFNKLYEKLKVDNRLTYSGAKQTSSTVTKSSNNSYSTNHYPLLPAQQGSFLRVWLYNPTSGGTFKELSNSDYVVTDYSLGIIEIITSFPAGFTEVFASYSYFTDRSKEDFNSYVTSNLQTSATIDTKDFSTPTQRYPVTRNVTDYITGQTPVLKKANFNELSPNYYPVIEYYQTSENELIFSESLYQYGDNPGVIEVTYSTLNIQPSLLLTVTRDGSYVSTPQIKSVNLHTKESQAVNI